MSERLHVGDDAALYALGALDESSRRAVERHARGCRQCNRLLGLAEDDVARMTFAEPQRLPPPNLLRRAEEHVPRVRPGWPVWGGLAAALLLAILPSAYYLQQNRVMHEAMSAHADAMSRLAETAVRSTAFAGMTGEASARVMYPPDGSWYVILVRGSSAALDVAWMHDHRRTMLGRTQPYGDVAMLYLPKSHRMDQLALVDGQRVVAEAQLAYESK
ncbi:MAG: hypothetical protein WB615_14975 [Candidatus Tumulicola sp.]